MKRVVWLLALLASPAASWGVVHLRTPLQIPMRDGQTLAADVYLPGDKGAWPVVLIQTPYNKSARFPLIFQYEVSQDPLLKSPDYAFVVSDWRGFFGSTDAPV